MPLTYRLNEPDASAEIFDGEVLAINLSNGHYHSVRGSGVIMWKLLVGGCSVTQVVHAVHTAFPDAPATVDADVRSFVDQLVAGGLLVESTNPSQSPAGELNLPLAGAPYSQPVFESHMDMQDLLLIDPIHDVDVQVGWPLRATTESRS